MERDICDFCLQYKMDTGLFPDESTLTVEESVLDECSCIVCWEESDCQRIPVSYTKLVFGVRLCPETVDLTLCPTCLERVKREDFSRVVCVDTDDLIDNHIAKLY
jgi:hypothetical protein